MPNAFIDKLKAHVDLSLDDINLLEAACANARDVPTRHNLIREGDTSGPLFVILEGWACRYQIMPDGARQITAFLMPGDSSDFHLATSHVMDHSVATLTAARVASIARAEFEHLIASRPVLTQALWWTQVVEIAVLRARIVSLGRRSSLERVAHLMCELYIRARNIGLTTGDELDLPLSQLVLSDALGLTPVHVNRVLRNLRMLGIMRLRAGVLVIQDIVKLADLAGFDEQYLQRKFTRRA